MFFKWRRDSKEQELKRARARLHGDTGYANAPMELLLSLDRETLATLPSSTLARLPSQRIFALPDAALSPELLGLIPPSVIVTLPPDQLSRLGNLPASTLEHLSINIISHLPPSALANLPSERLSLLPVEVLSSLPWSTIRTLPPETLARLPMSTLMTLPPETLAKLSSDAISQLPLRIRQRVPQEILDALRPLPSEPSSATSTTYRQDVYEERSMQQPQQQQEQQQPLSDTPRKNDRPTPNPSETSKSDENNTRPQKRASYRYLRRQSRGELRGTSQADIREQGSASASQPSEIRVTSPLGAVITEDHDLHREGSRRRSATPKFSGPHRPSTQRSSLDPSPNTLVRANKEVSESSYSGTSTSGVGVVVGETRIPSSSSHKSATKDRNTRQSWQSTSAERSPVPESQTNTHRPLSPGTRSVPVHRYQIDETGKYAPERPPHQYSSVTEEQLQESLRDRERLVAELQTDLDYGTRMANQMESEVFQLQTQLRNQKSRYETELDDIRNALAREQSQREESSLLLSKAQEELSAQKNDLHKRIKGLKLDLLAQKSHYEQKFQEQQQRFNTEQAHGREKLDEVVHKYGEKLANLKSDGVNRVATHEQDMRSKDAEHMNRLQGLKEDYRDGMNNLAKEMSKQSTYFEQERGLLEARIQADRDYFQTEMHALSENHQRAMQEQALEHSRKDNSLRMEAGDFIRQTSDDNLKGRFRKLKIAVEVIAEPFNLGSVVIHPGSGLDPSGFLQREKGMQRHLLRSLVWTRIMDGFFSAPFGFGVLGSGTGKQMLVDLFLHWRKLFAAHQIGRVATGAHTPDASFDLYDFWRDRDINRWRTATFQSIMAIVTAGDGERTASEGAGMVANDAYSTNCARVQGEILKLLNEATNNHVSSGIEEKVSEVTCLAAELALEIGAHRACLGLEHPNKGDTVHIGPDFVDCEDGNAARGESEEVELVVCPLFFKIGDGRNDMMTRKSIFPGEIYTVRIESGQ